MKKACLIFVLSLISSYIFAQGVEVGLQIAPTISFNRLNEDIKNGDFEKNGSKLKFSAGPVIDINLTDNIAFSTGIFFSSKAVKYSAKISDDNGATQTDATFDVDLQYLQLPVGLKLYTGNIGSSGLRIYAEIGSILDAKIAEKYDTDTEYNSTTENLTSEEIDQTFAKLLDAELHFGLGTEIEVGDNKAYIGLIYNRGLVDILHKDFHELTIDNAGDKDQRKKLTINSDLIGLVVGFKF